MSFCHSQTSMQMYVFLPLCVCVRSEQPQVHFRIRNRQTGLMMALTGDLDDIKLMRIQEMEENGELDQIWFYRNGRLRCKVAAADAASRHTKNGGVRKVSNQNHGEGATAGVSNYPRLTRRERS